MTRVNSPRIFVGDNGETSAYITLIIKVKPGEDLND